MIWKFVVLCSVSLQSLTGQLESEGQSEGFTFGSEPVAYLPLGIYNAQGITHKVTKQLGIPSLARYQIFIPYWPMDLDLFNQSISEVPKSQVFIRTPRQSPVSFGRRCVETCLSNMLQDFSLRSHCETSCSLRQGEEWRWSFLAAGFKKSHGGDLDLLFLFSYCLATLNGMKCV